MNKHASAIVKLVHRLRKQAACLEKSPPRTFGYRERVQIERSLFLILKLVCLSRLGYALQGLTDVHRKALFEHLESTAQEPDVKAFARDVFEFRVFLRSLSSTNPYVQGDALSRVGLTRQNVITSVVRRLHRVGEDAMGTIGEQADPGSGGPSIA